MNNPVVVGKFGSPYGVKGWIKVISFTSPIEKLLSYSPWFIFKDGSLISIGTIKGKLQGDHLVVQIKGCQDRDFAKSYTHLEIYIERAQLPILDEEEYYWVDLIGLSVINQENIYLGKVEQLLETGSNDVLIAKDDSGKEHYIPYLKDVICKVDLETRTILVDWDEAS